jgi:hypothetical protein
MTSMEIPFDVAFGPGCNSRRLHQFSSLVYQVYKEIQGPNWGPSSHAPIDYQ